MLEGEPGTGKTELAEAYSRAMGEPLIPYQCHNWSDSDDLFCGVDVPAAVAGEADKVRQLGVLARASQLSQKRPVIVLLDEIDKASEHTESLLLDWLQSGRVPIRPGVTIRANFSNMLIFITANDMRPLGEALYRRTVRVRMEQLPADVFSEVIQHKGQCPRAIADRIVKLCDLLSKEGMYLRPSIQECVQLSRTLRISLDSTGGADYAITQHLCRTPDAVKHLTSREQYDTIKSELASIALDRS